jgi:hypothetical protein
MMATRDTLKGTSTTSFSLRTSGPQPITSCGNYGFLLQTFGVEKAVTHNYCAIADKLKGTGNMQAFKAIGNSYPNPDDPNDEGTTVEEAGPYKSVSYQARRVVVDIDSSGLNLLFTGTEQFSSIYCDDESAMSGNGALCELKVL